MRDLWPALLHNYFLLCYVLLSFQSCFTSSQRLIRLFSPLLRQQGCRLQTCSTSGRMVPYAPCDFLQLTVTWNWQSYAFYVHCVVKEPEVQDVAYYVQCDMVQLLWPIFVAHFLLRSQPMACLLQKRIWECSLMYSQCQLLALCLAVDLSK